VRKLMRRGFNS